MNYKNIKEITRGCSIYGVNFSPSGRYMAFTDYKGRLSVYDMTSLTEIVNDKVAEKSYCCSFSPQETLVAVGTINGVVIYNLHTKQKETFAHSSNAVWTVFFTPGHPYFVFCSYDGEIKIYTYRENNVQLSKVAEFKHDTGVYAVQVDHDGVLYSCDHNGTLKLSNITNGQLHKEHKFDFNEVKVFKLAPNCAAALMAGQKTTAGRINIKIVRLPDFSLIRELPATAGTLWGGCWALSGEYIAVSGSSTTIEIFETKNWSRVCSLTAKSTSNYDVCFSPDNRFLVAGGNSNQNLILWERTN